MKYEQVIPGFNELLQQRKKFDEQTLQELREFAQTLLPQLTQILKEYSGDRVKQISKVIASWCAERQPLGDNLRKINIIRVKSAKKANPADEQEIKTNISNLIETFKSLTTDDRQSNSDNQE